MANRRKKIAVQPTLQRIPHLANRGIWVRKDVGDESSPYSGLRVDKLHHSQREVKGYWQRDRYLPSVHCTSQTTSYFPSFSFPAHPPY